MREDEVGAATVDLEVDAEDLLRHRGALDVPPRPPATPRRLPGGVLAGFLRLPEREVVGVPLERGDVVLPLINRLDGPVRELPVAGEALDAEVHVPSRHVRVSRLEQLLDERN